MEITIDGAAEARIKAYFDGIGDILGNAKRRVSFAKYAWGLLADGERKSVEPIATRDCPDPEAADAAHQRLLHFLNDSEWSNRDVRRYAARYALAAMTERAEVLATIVDDTGFPKQGKHSVGVQRQYTGTLGKIANCQIGVSLVVATPNDQLPIDFELYLPKLWADDAARRKEARIPDDVVFKTKPELALDMLRRAVDDGLPLGTILADAAYGNSSAFREGVRKLKLDFAVGIDSTTKVWLCDSLGRRHGDAISARDLAARLRADGKFKRITYSEATKEALWSRFAIVRVVACHDDGHEPSRRDRLWLVCEWPPGESAPSKFHFATYRRMPYRWIVHLLKERWRTERAYEDLKGELGLDHFEGRRFPGWHHHVSVALCCYAFIVAERARHFPPSASRPLEDQAFAFAA